MKYDVTARVLELSTLIDLKAAAQNLVDWLPAGYISLPEKPNTWSSTNENELYWIGRDHWLVRSHINNETALDLDSVPDAMSAVIVSDMMTFFDVSGPDTDEIISIVCPLNIQLNKFPENGVSFTEAFGLKALLIRRKNGYELAVDRSYTVMMKDVLQRAGANID